MKRSQSGAHVDCLGSSKSSLDVLKSTRTRQPLLPTKEEPLIGAFEKAPAMSRRGSPVNKQTVLINSTCPESHTWIDALPHRRLKQQWVTRSKAVLAGMLMSIINTSLIKVLGHWIWPTFKPSYKLSHMISVLYAWIQITAVFIWFFSFGFVIFNYKNASLTKKMHG